ncbi:hypothetical protein AX14_010799, partial [Amanita brunnescens Koide BX004]
MRPLGPVLWSSLMSTHMQPPGLLAVSAQCKEMIAGLPPLGIILNQCLHRYRAHAAALLPSHIICATMTNKWANPAYSHVSPKTRPAHLPSNDLPKRIHTHMIRKQFDYHNPVQQPGSRVLDLFHNCIVVDTYLPKKMSDHFKAW